MAKSLAVMFGIKPGEDEEHGSEGDDEEDPAEAAAGLLIDAIKKGDAAGVVEALGHLLDNVRPEGGEHDEGDEEEMVR